ncbi:hypothetical protein SAMN05421684_6108 [Asanoa ishikariensis]|uniref:DUF3592 domain-containing protein n=1 Tax=Asanoa ishikariensis TaxID=137265 RepID=A0A1H3TNC6_9ACTN|nr:hypothetical protein SAMN05421684_6108 [Asanoa ishikariensis]
MVTLVIGVSLTVWGLEGYLAHHGGVAGQVRVSTCDEVDPHEWSCEGTFVSDDGTVRIAEIDIMPIHLGSDPGELTERASVSGPGASTAWLESERFPTPLIVGLVMLAAFVVSGIVLLRLARAQATTPLPVAATPAALRTGSPRANRVIWKAVVVGWLLPLAALTVAISEYNRFNAAQEGRLSQTGDGIVTQVSTAGDRGIGVTVTAPDGRAATVRLTPADPDAYPEGTRVPFRYDPRDPGFALPVDESRFEVLWVIERDSWSQFVFLLGIALGVVWTWRLGRWATGAWRRRLEPGVARGVVAAPVVGRAALWLEIVDGHGERWHQRILWDRRLVEALPAGLDFAVELRRCLGFRRMYVVDVAGVGRLWPGSTARRIPPFTSTFGPFEPTAARPGGSLRGFHLGVVLPVGLVAATAWYFADPTMGLLAATLFVAYTLWNGAVPARGVYLSGNLVIRSG